MKKILIIQTDAPSFLHPTLSVIHRYLRELPDTEITLLMNAHSFEALKNQFPGFPHRVCFEEAEIMGEIFDSGVNLSLIESSWKLLECLDIRKRLGIYTQKEQIRVSDHWSTYLLTLKSPVPFLSFHLEEIYRNILGIGQAPEIKEEDFHLKRFVFALSPTALFPAGEQEALLNLLAKRFPGIPILDISETKVEDQEGAFFIGPAGPEPLLVNYPQNLLLQKKFQGSNLLPTNSTWILTTQVQSFTAARVMEALEKILGKNEEIAEELSLYRFRFSEEGDSFIEQVCGQEESYPIYLAYFVLWSFVLGLKEFEPAFPTINPTQKEFIRFYLGILKKIARFHTYALASLDILLAEAKSSSSDSQIIEGHLENLRQIDETLRKLSDSHPMLRPLLDFYHIRRGQNDGSHFREQVENSLLIYHEEHQAFTAFQELLETIERR